jgi:hypothetical protein
MSTLNNTNQDECQCHDDIRGVFLSILAVVEMLSFFFFMVTCRYHEIYSQRLDTEEKTTKKVNFNKQ